MWFISIYMIHDSFIIIYQDHVIQDHMWFMIICVNSDHFCDWLSVWSITSIICVIDDHSTMWFYDHLWVMIIYVIHDGLYDIVIDNHLCDLLSFMWFMICVIHNHLSDSWSCGLTVRDRESNSSAFKVRVWLLPVWINRGHDIASWPSHLAWWCEEVVRQQHFPLQVDARQKLKTICYQDD